MNFVYYVIKDYTEDDFSQKWKPQMRSEIHEDNLEWVAEEIADYHYHGDPCDPDAFDCIIGVKWNDIVKWFRVGAQIDIHFDVNEIEEGQE
jgi:hypothetical protein